MKIETKYNIHDVVKIIEIGCRGIIISVEVTENVLSEKARKTAYRYNVEYWLNGEKKLCWLFEEELKYDC